jgi:CspA family cold shock protein
MSYKDTWEVDDDGNNFVFTVEMKRRLDDAGLPIAVESLAKLEVRPENTGESTAQKDEPKAAEKLDIIQIDPETGKYLGRLKWYNPSRGYGFISRGGGDDIFFHRSSALGKPEEMNEGQLLLYDVEERSKGPEATEVEPYEGELV